MHIKALYKLKSLRECNRLLLKSESISTYRVFSTLSLEYLVHSFVTGIVISRDYILLWNIDFIAYANRGASFEVNKNKQKDVIVVWYKQLPVKSVDKLICIEGNLLLWP